MSQLDKWSDAQPAMITLREFLEWLDRQKIELAVWRPHGTSMLPITEDRERLLARFLEIDEAELERERRAILKKCQSR